MSGFDGQPMTLASDRASHSSLHLTLDESRESPTIASGIPGRQPIALICVHNDPALRVGEQGVGSQSVYVRQVGEALAKLGWQVDIFTRKSTPDAPTIIQHSVYCRTIRLAAGPSQFIGRDQLLDYMPSFVEMFQKFQSKEGTHYPLIHTNYWLSAWVGLQLKQSSNIQLVHTYHSLGVMKSPADSARSPMLQARLAVEQQILEQANCVIVTSPQKQESLRSVISGQKTRSPRTHQNFIQLIPYFNWPGVAHQLSHLYRRMLAQSIMDERLWHLPIPSPGVTETSSVSSVPSSARLTLAS